MPKPVQGGSIRRGAEELLEHKQRVISAEAASFVNTDPVREGRDLAREDAAAAGEPERPGRDRERRVHPVQGGEVRAGAGTVPECAELVRVQLRADI